MSHQSIKTGAFRFHRRLSFLIGFLQLAAQPVAAAGCDNAFICHFVLRKRRNEVLEKVNGRPMEPVLKHS